MKILNTKQSVTIPDEVEVSVKARVVTVKGARGTLVKSFRHLAIDIFMTDAKTLEVIYFSPAIIYSYILQRARIRQNPKKKNIISAINN